MRQKQERTSIKTLVLLLKSLVSQSGFIKSSLVDWHHQTNDSSDVFFKYQKMWMMTAFSLEAEH